MGILAGFGAGKHAVGGAVLVSGSTRNVLARRAPLPGIQCARVRKLPTTVFVAALNTPICVVSRAHRNCWLFGSNPTRKTFKNPTKSRKPQSDLLSQQ